MSLERRHPMASSGAELMEHEELQDTFSELIGPDSNKLPYPVDLMPTGDPSAQLRNLAPFGSTSAASSAPAPLAPAGDGAQGARVLNLADTIPAEQSRLQDGRGQKGGGGAKEKGGRFRQADPEYRASQHTEPPWADVTTVMMRNLPNKYTQQMLLEELQDGGFHAQQDFDFFYLPMDHNNAANLGYCFINFVGTPNANAFVSSFQGKKMRRFNSGKTVVVVPASIQGFDKNYAYYSSTRVAQAQDPQYRPVFLRQPSEGVAPPRDGKGRGRGKSDGGKGGRRGKDAMRGAPVSGGKGKDKRQGKAGPNNGMPRTGFEASGAGGMRGAPWQSQGPPMQDGHPEDMPTPPPPPPLPASSAFQRVCPQCHKVCGNTHRFCAFCGAGVPMGPNHVQANDVNGGYFLGNAPPQPLFPAPGSLRADAPTFVPGGPLLPNRQAGPEGLGPPGPQTSGPSGLLVSPAPQGFGPSGLLGPAAPQGFGPVGLQLLGPPGPQVFAPGGLQPLGPPGPPGGMQGLGLGGQRQMPMQYNAQPSHLPNQQQQQAPRHMDQQHQQQGYNDSVTDDVARGRMMLINALKDMHTKDGRAPDGSSMGMDRNFPNGSGSAPAPFAMPMALNGDPMAGPLPGRSAPSGYGPPGRSQRMDWQGGQGFQGVQGMPGIQGR